MGTLAAFFTFIFFILGFSIFMGLRDYNRVKRSEQHKDNMLIKYPNTYWEPQQEGIDNEACVKVNEETIYCFDSDNRAQYIETSDSVTFLRLVDSLRHYQADISLSKRLDSIFVLSWDDVYYIPSL